MGNIKARIGALLELYLLAAGYDFTPTESMTLESKAAAVKREADKSYKLAPDRVRPDLAIEVVFTSGGINKLEAYKRLKIPEVWFWEDGVLEVTCEERGRCCITRSLLRVRKYRELTNADRRRLHLLNRLPIHSLHADKSHRLKARCTVSLKRWLFALTQRC